MSNVTPGKETTEFKMTALTNIINAALALFVAYGLLTQDQAGLWSSLLVAVLVAALPIASAIMTREYTRGRTALKFESMLQPGAAQARPEAAE